MRINKNRLLAILTLSIMLIMQVFTVALAEEIADPGSVNRKIYDAQYIGDPLNETLLLNCVLGVEDGKNMLYTTMSGKPDGSFIVYNLDDNKTERTFELKGVKNSWQHAIDSKGNVYMVPHGYIKVYKYSPETKQITESELVTGETAAYGLCIDENDKVYFGTFPNAKVIKYDPETEKIIDFGQMFPGQAYVMSMAYHDGFLYAGGQDPSARFIKINVKTREKTNLVNPEGLEVLPANFQPINFYMMSQRDKYIFSQMKDASSYYMCVYDIEQQKWVKAFKRSFGHYVSPVVDGKVYMLGSLPSDINANAFFSVKLGTWETEDTGIRYYGNYTGGGWVELKNHPELPGTSLVTVQKGKVLAFNLQTKQAVFFEDAAFPSNALHVQDMEVGKGNTLIMGGYMSDIGKVINTDTGEEQNFPVTQTEAIVKVDEKTVYIGCYTQATLRKLDLTRPLGTDNPKMLCSFGAEMQDRIYDIEVDGTKIYMGTTPMKGFTDGGIGIYDTATGQKEFIKSPIKEQSIEGLAVKDGVLYGSSSIYSTSHPTQTEAKVFSIDLDTKKVITEKAVNIPGADALVTIGDLEVGPDGLIWGVSGGAVFALDPSDLSIVKQTLADKVYPRRTLPTIAHLVWDKDGMLYTNCNGFFTIINPVTMETRKTKISGAYHVIGNDGNIYMTGYSSNTHKLSKFTISSLMEEEYNAVAEKISNAIVLSIGNFGASVNGTIKQVDAANKEIVPMVVDSRTLVPVRFIAEAAGATVSWDEATQNVLVTMGDKNIKLKIGENSLYINGNSSVIDVPAQVIGGRTMLPLRALVEALGKSVFWDNRGLIVISDNPSLLSTSTDEKVIGDIFTYMSSDVSRLLTGAKLSNSSK